MKDETSEQGDVPFFKIGTFGGVADVFISRDKYEEYKAKYPYPRKGDVLISAAGTIGRLVVFDGTESYFQDCNIVWVENDERTVLNSYLYYALKLARWKPSQGSTILRLYNDDIRAVSFYAHESKDAQRAVANLLSALDRKIALNRRKIATLEKMAKEIYDYWFVQYDFPDANDRPYKSSGGEMVYSPELKREIPKGWKVTKIADVLAKIPSTERVQTVNYADSGAIPIIDQSEKFIAGYTENNAAALALNSCVVFGDHSCTVKYVNFSFARGADGTQILHSNTPMVDDTQLYFNLLGIDFDEGYKRHFTALKDKLIVISPDASLTATYTSVVDGLFAQIRVLRQKTNTISALRDFLLPLLMNGQVKVGE